MTIYHQMLTWLIPQEELTNGLIAPVSSPAAKAARWPAPFRAGAYEEAGPDHHHDRHRGFNHGVTAASLHRQARFPRNQ